MRDSTKQDLISLVLWSVLVCLFLYAVMEDGFGIGWENRQKQAAIDLQQAVK